MLRILRSFRQRLLEQNRFKSYLVYAIGEIVLVVIGILIALQINNLNALSKNRDKELVYYENLIAEAEEINRIVENRLDYEKKIQRECERALFMLNEPNLNYDSLSSVLSLVSTRMSFVSYGPIFEEMKYSGNLSLIRSIPLKNEITRLYEEMDYISFVVSENNDRFMDGLILFLLENPFVDYGFKTNRSSYTARGDYETIEFENSHAIQKSMLSDQKLKFKLHNHISNRISVTAVHVRLYDEFLNNTFALKEKIEEELKKRRK